MVSGSLKALRMPQGRLHNSLQNLSRSNFKEGEREAERTGELTGAMKEKQIETTPFLILL